MASYNVKVEEPAIYGLINLSLTREPMQVLIFDSEWLVKQVKINKKLIRDNGYHFHLIEEPDLNFYHAYICVNKPAQKALIKVKLIKVKQAETRTFESIQESTKEKLDGFRKEKKMYEFKMFLITIRKQKERYEKRQSIFQAHIDALSNRSK